MEFRTDIIVANAGAIAEGVCMTLLLTCFSFLVALALGTVVGVLRRRAGLLSALLGGYVSFFRGTPLLIQLFLIYYGLPSIGLNMPRYVAAVLSLGLNSAAYISEILRGALGAVPRGQEEAAQVLGLTRLDYR